MWWVVSEFEYDRDPTMGMVSAEEFNAMAARAEKAEADLARAVEERDAALVLVKRNEKGLEAVAWEITDRDIETLKPWRDLILDSCLKPWRASAEYTLLRERGLLGGERG